MSKRESRAANLLMCYAMTLAASYTMMRTVADSLFLSRIGSESLAAVFVASGTATALIAWVWFALTRRLNLAVAIRVSGITMAGLTITAWGALPFWHHSWWLLASIYLLAEIKGCVNAINLITAMNDVLGGHSSRFSWARIGLGAPLAGTLVGSLIGIEASFIDLRSWLLLSAFFDLVGLLPLANLSKISIPKPGPRLKSSTSMATTTSRVISNLKRYACSRQFRFWIGVLIAAKVVVLTLVTFFWKVSVTEYYGGNEQSMTRYFGVFYACIGLLTLAIQGWLTGHLLSRKSLYVPILVMPVTLSVLAVIGAFGAGALFLLVILTLAKSLEIWRRSVHDTTLNMLYTKIERHKRRTAIAVNSAVVKPLAEVGASLVLLFGTPFWHKSIVALGLGVWIMATISLLRLVLRTQPRHQTRLAGGCPPETAVESNVEKLVPGLFNH